MAIKPEVSNNHLTQHSGELAWLKAFDHTFDINHACEWRAANALLSVYQVSPQDHVREAFGFEQELLLAYSKFDKLQARVIQAIDEFLTDGTAPRADRRVVLLVSEAHTPADWVKNYLADNRVDRLIVTFAADDLRAKAADPWHVRNELARQLYTKDLFGNLLALDSDAGFFGRSTDIQALRELVMVGGIGGLFGLRKIGKTSLLNKLRRELGKEGVAAHRLNCESSAVRTLQAHEFLDALSRLMDGSSAESGRLPAAAKRFTTAAAAATADGRRVVFLLDEIEKVSPFALQDRHWRTDFVHVWQELREAQDTNRRLSFVIAGVEPDRHRDERVLRGGEPAVRHRRRPLPGRAGPGRGATDAPHPGRPHRGAVRRGRTALHPPPLRWQHVPHPDGLQAGVRGPPDRPAAGCHPAPAHPW